MGSICIANVPGEHTISPDEGELIMYLTSYKNDTVGPHLDKVATDLGITRREAIDMLGGLLRRGVLRVVQQPAH